MVVDALAQHQHICLICQLLQVSNHLQRAGVGMGGWGAGINVGRAEGWFQGMQPRTGVAE